MLSFHDIINLLYQQNNYIHYTGKQEQMTAMQNGFFLEYIFYCFSFLYSLARETSNGFYLSGLDSYISVLPSFH